MSQGLDNRKLMNMRKQMDAPESLPHVKAGKNQTATSPNRHGCPKNDYNEHDYIVVKYYAFKLNNPLRKRLWMDTETLNNYSLRVLCIHCGKPKKRAITRGMEPVSAVLSARYEDEHTWHEVEATSNTMYSNSSLRIINTLDW